MQRKSSFTGLLITALCAVVSCCLNKQFHYVNEGGKTWEKAQQYCREKYIDLAFISNQDEENKTWEEALDHCRKHYTDLTSLLSENEQLLVQRMINSKGAQMDHVWTGLRFLASEWLWVNGDPLEYQAWTGGRLPHCPAQHLCCGTLAREGELWGTRDCEERRNFLCTT
eukprot:XP_014044809.1 PREDICTED: snaclec subunit B-like [Salmo salar]